MCPHPAVHLSLPPTTVAFFGEDLDGVSLLQRQLWAVPGWEVIPGPRYAETPHAASCQAGQHYNMDRLKTMARHLWKWLHSLPCNSLMRRSTPLSHMIAVEFFSVNSQQESECRFAKCPTIALTWWQHGGVCEATEVYCTWCGVWCVVRRVAFLRLFVRRTQRGVHILEVLFQRVLLVKLNQLLKQEEEEEHEQHIIDVRCGLRWEFTTLRAVSVYFFWSVLSDFGYMRLWDLRLNHWRLSFHWCGTGLQQMWS